MAQRSLGFIAALGSVLVLVGCSNVWRDNFVGAPVGYYESLPDDVRVDVREVPWSRVESALSEIEHRRAQSDTHWKDWSREELMDEQSGLLRALQISEDPEDIIVLGRSVFKSTDRVSPFDKELEAFARELGADYAIVSSNYLGKTDKIVSEPVTRSGNSWRTCRDSGGNYRSEYVPWSETVYVPVVVAADEYAWVVYYLRRR